MSVEQLLLPNINEHLLQAMMLSRFMLPTLIFIWTLSDVTRFSSLRRMS